MTKTNSNDKYGGLLNKYMDDANLDYATKMAREKNPKINTAVCLKERSRMIRFSMISLMSVMRVGIYSEKEQMNTNRQI